MSLTDVSAADIRPALEAYAKSPTSVTAAHVRTTLNALGEDVDWNAQD